MARSHHRKKHKEHLRQFKHTNEKATTSTVKGKAVWVFTIGGAIVGLMITYFAAKGNVAWTISGLLAGAIVGFIAGKKMDNTAV